MKITEYIAEHRMQHVDVQSGVRPGFVPASLAAKFTKGNHVEYYSDAAKTRWVGICRARDFFAASNLGVAVTTGTLNQDYPALRSF